MDKDYPDGSTYYDSPTTGANMTNLKNFTLGKFVGEEVADNERYVLKDNNALENLTVSHTSLKPNQETRGHKHDGIDEVYIFSEGYGRIQLDEYIIPVETGSVILIPGGVFHKVYNDSWSNRLEFMCVLQGRRGH